MKRLFTSAVVAGALLLHAGFSFGQTPKPKLFDAYGVINMEDVMARLDFFAIKLQEQPHSAGFIVSYGPEGSGSGTGTHLANMSMDYLVNSRGLSADQVQTIYAGRYKDPKSVFTQLWIVPFGASLPEPPRYQKKLKTVSGKFAESAGWDGEMDGPRHEYFGNLTVAALSERMRNQPASMVHVVAFGHPGATPGAWRRVAKLEVVDLEAAGVASDRIRIHYGGLTKVTSDDDYPQLVKLQYWILPADAALPMKEVAPEKTPKEAVMIGSYDRYDLEDKRNARFIFEGFADVLRADEQLRVCIIVRAGLPADSESSPDEPQKLDRNELVRKWKTELQEKFGVSESRIFIIQAGAHEYKPASIDVWVVPPGAAMPDPHAPEETEEETAVR